MTDEQLALAVQAGDTHAADVIVDRFGGYLRTFAVQFFDATGDLDDLLQEARIGAVKAIRDWRPEGGASFKSFLIICVKRHLIAYVIWTNRQKHRQLTYSLREAVNEDGDIAGVVDLLEAPHTDPVEIVAERDQLAEIVRVIRDELSPLERESLIGLAFLDETYAETEARILGFDADRPSRAGYSPVKVVDNALTRARAKLRVALEEPRPLGAAA